MCVCLRTSVHVDNGTHWQQPRLYSEGQRPRFHAAPWAILVEMWKLCLEWSSSVWGFFFKKKIARRGFHLTDQIQAWFWRVQCHWLIEELHAQLWILHVLVFLSQSWLYCGQEPPSSWNKDTVVNASSLGEHKTSGCVYLILGTARTRSDGYVFSISCFCNELAEPFDSIL